MAYFTIGDIPPQYRSKLSAIFLVTVAKADFVKRYGLQDVLGDFVRGLDKLNTMGMRVPNLGLVKGRLLFTMNDNPTAAMLSGMKQSASFSHKVCRTCEINKEQINTKITLEGLPNRCPEEHLRRCNDLEGDLTPQQRQTFSKHWGINERSILLKLPYLNIPTQFVHDILHVTLEGIFNQHTCLLIEYLCMNKIFSYKILNQRLASYSYSYLDSTNKPQMLKRINVQGKNSLKQTAIGTLLLAYILPHIISPRMKMLGLDNEAFLHYHNYLNLVNIVLLCTSIYIDGNTCGNIEQLIRTYLFKFKMYFPRVALTPKCHYLQHIPMNIKNFGPGRGMWTL